MPSHLAVAVAALLLVLMSLLELRSADGLPPIPLYFLLPISLLAWFAGWRPALFAATAAFAVTLAIVLLGGYHSYGAPTGFLLRLATFAFEAVFARGLSTARQIVELLYRRRGPQRPIRIGARLVVVPVLGADSPREDVETDLWALPIYIQAGRAFGTGSHATTRMCLKLLEQFMRSGATVLDVGCGTGILAIAAAKLGATAAYAIDKSPRAIQLAQVNSAHNLVSDKVTLLHGSFETLSPEILQDSFNIADDSRPLEMLSAGHRFDLILANVLTGVIKDLLGSGIPELLCPGGVLITSGILASELASVEVAIRASGLEIDQSVEEDGWCALVARRR